VPSLTSQWFLARAPYEVWNEPNLFASWLPAPDPAVYTQVLKSAYTAIKAADPNALVVGGALGAVVNFGGITTSPVDFVQQMYQDGAKGYFDALSFHPYQYTTMFSQGGIYPDAPINQLIAIRQPMINNGDSALRIWATEYGLPTAGPNGVTPQQQANFISDFLTAWKNLSYAGPSFIYATRDQQVTTAGDAASMGVFYYDWTPKLAAQVIKDAIAANQGSVGGGGGDPGAALGAALAAFYQQVFQSYVQAVATAYVNALAQALGAALQGLFGRLPFCKRTRWRRQPSPALRSPNRPRSNRSAPPQPK
jgi:hypothetical protein